MQSLATHFAIYQNTIFTHALNTTQTKKSNFIFCYNFYTFYAECFGSHKTFPLSYQQLSSRVAFNEALKPLDTRQIAIFPVAGNPLFVFHHLLTDKPLKTMLMQTFVSSDVSFSELLKLDYLGKDQKIVSQSQLKRLD